jgi:hypothetical protein
MREAYLANCIQQVQDQNISRKNQETNQPVVFDYPLS